MSDSLVKRIAIIGPESTGKSALAKELAVHYDEPWVPEFARAYLNDLGRDYKREDLRVIAEGQLESEDEMAKKARAFLFCDTNLIVIKIWSDHRYGETDPWILDQLENRRYDHYLLTDIDLPWVEDPQREHPTLRSHFFEIYRGYLEEHQLPYSVISGVGEKRLSRAIDIIKQL